MNLKHDESMALQGVLWSSRGAWLSLRETQLLKKDRPAQTMDGETLVHRSNVAFIQVLP